MHGHHRRTLQSCDGSSVEKVHPKLNESAQPTGKNRLSNPVLAELAAFPENGATLDLLIAQLKSRVGVVPFVGAGMSVSFGFPAWRQFLESQAPEAAVRECVVDLLDRGCYEETAEMLLKTQGDERFHAALERTYGAERLPMPLPAAGIMQLPRLCTGPVLTTNFDSVLEKVFENSSRPFEERIVGMKADATADAFHGNRRVLVKLHGDAADRKERVLTWSEYERAYGEREPLIAILRFAMTRPMLFLGCSLQNDRTVRVLDSLVEELRGRRAESLQIHYAVMERPANDDAFAARLRQLERLGIRALWYPRGRHELVGELLAYLADVAGRSPVSGSVPAEPPHYLLRESELEIVRSKLLASDGSTMAITGQGHTLGVEGMGGVGKTVLAAALTRDAAVQKAYPDGIFWLTVSSKPDLLSLLNQLAELLPDSGGPLSSEAQARKQLRDVLMGRRALLVLDDIWDIKHAAILNVMSAPGRLLVTTRKREVLIGLNAEEFRVDVLSDEGALWMLADWAGIPGTAQLPPEAAEVAHECGRLPLALAMIGAIVRLRPNAWADVLELLRSRDLDEFRRAFPDYPYPDLLRAIAVGVDDLPSADRRRYLDLAVFAEDEAVPQATLQALWKLSPAKTRACIDRLVARSLATRPEQGERGTVLLHDLQWKYARNVRGPKLVQLHNNLLRGYWKKCKDGWSSGPNDGYFFQHLCQHLRAAGRTSEEERMLMRFSWMNARTRATSVPALLSDYSAPQLSMRPGFRALLSALRMAAIHANSVPDLASQLCAHLFAHRSTAIKRFLRTISVHSAWLQPLNLATHQAGDSYLGFHIPQAGRIAALAMLPDDSAVLVLSFDGCIRLLDLDGGDELGAFQAFPDADTKADYAYLEGGVFEGETTSGVRHGSDPAIVMSHNADSIICLNGNRIVRAWRFRDRNLTNPTQQYEINGVTALAAFENGRILITAEGAEVKLRESATGNEIRTLPNGGPNISSIVPMSDGKHALLVYNDGEVVSHGIRMIDLVTGAIEPDLPDGYYDSASWVSWGSYDAEGGGRYVLNADRSINAVALNADERFLVAASRDRTLRVWDLRKKAMIQSLSGHSRSVNAVVAVPGTTWALSGSSDRTLKLWDLASGRHLRTLTGSAGEVYKLVVTQDGTRAVSAEKSRLSIWDLRTDDDDPAILPFQKAALGHLKEVFLTKGWESHSPKAAPEQRPYYASENEPDDMKTLSVSMDGKYVLFVDQPSAKTDEAAPYGHRDQPAGHIRLCEITTGACSDLGTTRDKIGAAAFTPDGRYLVYGSDSGTLKVLETSAPGDRNSLLAYTEEVTSVGVTPTSQSAVVGFSDGGLMLVDLNRAAMSSGENKYIESLEMAASGKEVGVRAFVDPKLGKKRISLQTKRDLEKRLATMNEAMTQLRHFPLSMLKELMRDNPNAYAIIRRFWKGGIDEVMKAELKKLPKEFLPAAHKDAVTVARVTPDGRCVVSGSSDGEIKVWSLDTFELLGIYCGHEGAVTDLCVTTDGKMLVSASADATQCLWRLGNPESLFTFRGHVGPVHSVVATPDGSRVASGGADATIRIWDLQRRVLVETLKGHLGSVRAIVVANRGKHIISCGAVREGNYMLAWNIGRENRKTDLMWHYDSVTAVAVTPDGLRAVTASTDKTLKIWDLRERTPLHILQGHEGKILGISLTPDGRDVVSASGGYDDNSLRLWSLGDGNFVDRIGGHGSLFGSINGVAVSPNGRWIVSASADNTLKVWDAIGRREIHTLVGHASYVNGVAITPDSRFIVSASADKTVKVWELESGNEVRTLAGHEKCVNAVAVMSDGSRVISASADKMLKVWDLVTGRELATLRGHSSYVNAVAVIGDTRYALSASADRCLKLWDIEHNEEVASFTAEAGLLSCAASPNGRIVAGDEDGGVYVFQLVEK